MKKLIVNLLPLIVFLALMKYGVAIGVALTLTVPFSIMINIKIVLQGGRKMTEWFKGGDLRVSGNFEAGDGDDGDGGNILFKSGDGKNGAGGGNLVIGPGVYKAGRGGSGGKGGDITFRAGDSE